MCQKKRAWRKSGLAVDSSAKVLEKLSISFFHYWMLCTKKYLLLTSLNTSEEGTLCKNSFISKLFSIYWHSSTIISITLVGLATHLKIEIIAKIFLQAKMLKMSIYLMEKLTTSVTKSSQWTHRSTMRFPIVRVRKVFGTNFFFLTDEPHEREKDVIARGDKECSIRHIIKVRFWNQSKCGKMLDLWAGIAGTSGVVYFSCSEFQLTFSIQRNWRIFSVLRF